MASPFHVFRKNQKALIATLGLLAIGAFVFLTPFVMYQNGRWGAGPEGDNPTVVTTAKYGNLTQRDINIMQGQKRRLLQFFQNLISVSCQDDYASMMQHQNEIRQFLGDTSEESVVNTWLLAQRAKELGMSVNDMIVADIIRKVTDDKATPKLIREIQSSSKLSEDALFDLLQQELLANNLRNSFLISLLPTTPGQRWDYFQRLNRKVSAQVSPVAVADFVAEVPEPTEKELKEFFEEHKNNISYPGSPTPGFRVPQMADVEYIKAEYDQFADPGSVTDEEIAKYYEENKDNFKVGSLPGLPEDLPLETPSLLRGLQGGLDTTKPAAKTPAAETPATETPAVEAPAEKAPAAEKPAAEAPATEAPATETPAAETPAAEKKEAAPEKPAEPAKPEEAPATEAPATEAPATEAPATEAPKNPEPQKSEPDTSSVTRSVFHLVSMQDTDNKAAEPAAEAAQPAETTKPVTTEPATTPDSTKLNLSPSTIGAGLSELDPLTSQAPTISGNTYKPLEEVKDEIRSTLAWQKTIERMEKVLGSTKKAIKTHNDELAISEAEISEKENSELLSKFVKELAEKNKLTYGKTGLLSAMEIYETEVGKSIVKDVHQPVAAVIIDRMSNQQIRPSSDIDQNYYLFWRVTSTEEKTPELSDEGVREKVVQAWKQVQARELAIKEAKRLAKAAEESGSSLRNSIGKSEGVPIKSTGEFSWFKRDYTQNLAPGRPENVDAPGSEFMKAVYGLEPNGVTVAMNGPKSIVYVIQLTDTTPSDKVLWTVFKSDSFENYASIAGADLRQISYEWIKNLQDEAGLKWERSPIKPSARQQ